MSLILQRSNLVSHERLRAFLVHCYPRERHTQLLTPVALLIRERAPGRSHLVELDHRWLQSSRLGQVSDGVRFLPEIRRESCEELWRGHWKLSSGSLLTLLVPCRGGALEIAETSLKIEPAASLPAAVATEGARVARDVQLPHVVEFVLVVGTEGTILDDHLACTKTVMHVLAIEITPNIAVVDLVVSRHERSEPGPLRRRRTRNTSAWS